MSFLLIWMAWLGIFACIASLVTTLVWVGRDRRNTKVASVRPTAVAMAILTVAFGFTVVALIHKMNWYDSLGWNEQKQYQGNLLTGAMALLALIGVVQAAFKEDDGLWGAIMVLFGSIAFLVLSWNWFWYEMLGVWRLTFILLWVYAGIILCRFVPVLTKGFRRARSKAQGTPGDRPRWLRLPMFVVAGTATMIVVTVGVFVAEAFSAGTGGGGQTGAILAISGYLLMLAAALFAGLLAGGLVGLAVWALGPRRSSANRSG